MVDTVLSGGWIIDGTRTPPYQADLCIQDGKIVAISPQWEGNCRTRVDVTEKSSLPVLLTFTPILIPVHFLLSFRKVK